MKVQKTSTQPAFQPIELKVYNWDGKCIPYGDTDGNTRLDEILK